MENEKKKGKGSVVAIVILLLLVVGLCGYIVCDKVLSGNKENITINNENTKNEVKEKNEITEPETTNNEDCITSCPEIEPIKPRCYGTYYVNGDKNLGIYNFNEDGTYKVENSEQGGVFVIYENTITLIDKKHTVGPRDQDPYLYGPKTYLLSDDCSTIRLTESGAHVSAELKKAN